MADGQGQTPIARAKTRASEALLLQCSHLWDAGAAGTQSTVLSVTSWDAGALGTQVTVLCATRWDAGAPGKQSTVLRATSCGSCCSHGRWRLSLASSVEQGTFVWQPLQFLFQVLVVLTWLTRRYIFGAGACFRNGHPPGYVPWETVDCSSW